MKTSRTWWVVGLCWGLATFWASAQNVPGWRLGAAAWSFNKFTLFEAIEKTAALGLSCVEAYEGQALQRDTDAKLDAGLSDAQIGRLRQKLQSARVTLTSLYIHRLPAEPAACRQAFELGRKLGIEFFVSEPEPEALDTIEKLCEEYKIRVAIHDHREGTSRYWHPREVLKACQGRSWRLGACADIGHWQRSGLDVVEGIRLLGERLISVHVKDLNQTNPDGHDVPWGEGKGNLAAVFREIHRSGVEPALFTIEYEYHWEDNTREMAACAEFYRRVVGELAAAQAAPQPLTVGWAQADITPTRPVALIGQLTKRVSQGVRDPLTATALALETRRGTDVIEQAVLVSCDLIWVRREIQERLRARVAARLPDLNPRKVLLNATHTHTAPDVLDGSFGALYDTSDDPTVMKPSAYAEFFLERVADAVVRAWTSRQPGTMNWGLTSAEVGVNRRAHYFDGTSTMYGDTAQARFSHFEAGDDHAVKTLFFRDAQQRLTGLLVNLPCTAQETEQLSEVSADFWHDIRLELRRRHGAALFVLGQCSTAGDLSPHPVYRKRAEELMLQRRQISRRQELARRVANAVDDAAAVSPAPRVEGLVFAHRVLRRELPRQTTVPEPFYSTDAPNPAEIHVLRLGDVALATHPFELYRDYGVRIEARSRAPLTLLSQLTCHHSGYLPTDRAVRGGGYSADAFVVGPVGGQILVEETVSGVNSLWPETTQ